MNRRELLTRLAGLEPIQVEGEFERHTSLKREATAPSASGGRWGAPGAYEVLYLGRPRDSVVIEAYRHLVEDELDQPADLAAAVLERRVTRLSVEVPNVVDLRSPEARATLGLDDADLFSDVGNYEPCQEIGAAAHQLELSGIIAPAATRLGETLALFELNVSLQHWPTPMESEIWKGLPPDPRSQEHSERRLG